jgi:hypothetical protein
VFAVVGQRRQWQPPPAAAINSKFSLPFGQATGGIVMIFLNIFFRINSTFFIYFN